MNNKRKRPPWTKQHQAMVYRRICRGLLPMQELTSNSVPSTTREVNQEFAENDISNEEEPAKEFYEPTFENSAYTFANNKIMENDCNNDEEMFYEGAKHSLDKATEMLSSLFL